MLGHGGQWTSVRWRDEKDGSKNSLGKGLGSRWSAPHCCRIDWPVGPGRLGTRGCAPGWGPWHRLLLPGSSENLLSESWAPLDLSQPGSRPADGAASSLFSPPIRAQAPKTLWDQAFANLPHFLTATPTWHIWASAHTVLIVLCCQCPVSNDQDWGELSSNPAHFTSAPPTPCHPLPATFQQLGPWHSGLLAPLKHFPWGFLGLQTLPHWSVSRAPSGFVLLLSICLIFPFLVVFVKSNLGFSLSPEFETLQGSCLL